MKMRNKGKVYPTPSSSSPSSSTPSSSSSTTNNKDVLSILKLLPAAILALVSVLSLEDKEVLAYMITRSIKATNPSSILEEKTKKNTKKKVAAAAAAHKPPMFDCECFDCYTSYWCKWDSSPNRELIHQAIEAFEEHLTHGESSTKKARNKKREQKGRRGAEKIEEILTPENQETAQGSPENDVCLPDIADVVSEDARDEVMEMEREESREIVVARTEAAPTVRSAANGGGHKGLARKVLPDVLGLFNSRLWSLWSPNV